MKPFAYAALVLALSLFAGRLLVESWHAAGLFALLLANCAGTVLALVALIIRAVGKEETVSSRKRLGAGAITHAAPAGSSATPAVSGRFLEAMETKRPGWNRARKE